MEATANSLAWWLAPGYGDGGVAILAAMQKRVVHGTVNARPLFPHLSRQFTVPNCILNKYFPQNAGRCREHPKLLTVLLVGAGLN